MKVHQWENEERYTFPNKSFLNPAPALENIRSGSALPCVWVALEAVFQQPQDPETGGRREDRVMTSGLLLQLPAYFVDRTRVPQSEDLYLNLQPLLSRS